MASTKTDFSTDPFESVDNTFFIFIFDVPAPWLTFYSALIGGPEPSACVRVRLSKSKYISWSWKIPPPLANKVLDVENKKIITRACFFLRCSVQRT